ncbi:hypothetical protein BDV30DRAFT_236792 [Aspergillus minisclerotigenes]|uniref:Uncharacterized protein n=1 Tax=Aspergillus minisclerotigenes TaxID=656917 RepID=A0A5N6J9G8_9EURO|nr:hypothetical protein BDV30DRAFT_236792 [Aspergillus minisclerotigenes]
MADDLRVWNIFLSGRLSVRSSPAQLVLLCTTDPTSTIITHAPDGSFIPEARLPSMVVGGIMVPVGMFWLAGTGSAKHPMAESSARQFLGLNYCVLVLPPGDLEEAIGLFTKAVEVTPNTDPTLISYLSNLGSSLEGRYDLFGHRGFLEDATWLSRKLERRYKRTENINDLEETIRVLHQAVDATPANDSNLLTYLANQIDSLESRYYRREVISDLECAIRLSRKAVKILPVGHPDFAGWLRNLAVKLEAPYNRITELEDLEQAIQLSRQAITVTQDGHHNRTRTLAIWRISLERDISVHETYVA